MTYTVYNNTTLEHYDTNDYDVAYRIFNREVDYGCDVQIVNNDWAEIIADSTWN